ncbi:hypothetical protein FSP39_008591 [Pinctada imbricata]|uniref:Tyrosinase copper-binding domain-containing protein n=1 Tax=Pinctada imbricata TaxID=66713 RepID=A0AA88XQS5_PINIB|nr:hypothetical protein FSP39_008591 [Pinctada imbricata]
MVLVCIAVTVEPQGVFIHPFKKNGKTEIELIKIEPSLDFDVHNESMFRSPESAKFEFPLTKADIQWLNSLFVLPAKNERRVRKEYRTLSEEERETFHRAINALKHDKSVSLNKYDLLANIHSRPSSNSAAHGGPAFLGWHRVFLLMMENALRQVEPSITIPYWDCTMDAHMTSPAQSAIWSQHFFGNGLGVVDDGPFANWTTPFGFGLLKRSVSGQRRLITKQDVARLMEHAYLGNISYPYAKADYNLEQLHNNVHVWVGGLMKNIEIGAFDPVFYLLHSFIDKIWEDFRRKQILSGIDPTRDYPKFYGRSSHAPLAPMGLAKLTAIDGISDIWREGILYVRQPDCRNVLHQCNSDFLKCDNDKSECVSKTRDEYQTETEASSAMSDGAIKRGLLKQKTGFFVNKSNSPMSISVFTQLRVDNSSVTQRKKSRKDRLHFDVYKKFGQKDWTMGLSRMKSLYRAFQFMKNITLSKLPVKKNLNLPNG